MRPGADAHRLNHRRRRASHAPVSLGRLISRPRSAGLLDPLQDFAAAQHLAAGPSMRLIATCWRRGPSREWAGSEQARKPPIEVFIHASHRTGLDSHQQRAGRMGGDDGCDCSNGSRLGQPSDLSAAMSTHFSARDTQYGRTQHLSVVGRVHSGEPHPNSPRTPPDCLSPSYRPE